MKTSLSFLILLLASAGNSIVRAAEDSDDHDHDHDHEEGHPCACEAEELNFDINCADTATMLSALQSLQSDGCATDCKSDDCVRNYFIVQSHHDYCPEEGLPSEIEDGFHDYDLTCEACSIARKAVDGAPTCPTANCDDTSGNDAYDALIQGGCQTDCAGAGCKENFFTLRAVHDDCPHDTLSQAAEEGIHDLEEACKAQACNPAASLEGDQLVCTEEVGVASTKSAAATASVKMLAASLVAAIVVVVI